MEPTIMDYLETMRVSNHPVNDSKAKTGNDKPSNISASVIRQIKAARVLLNWPQTELAYRAKTTPLTISRLERRERNTRFSTLLRIQQALEAAGIVFLEQDEYGGIGVRLQA